MSPKNVFIRSNAPRSAPVAFSPFKAVSAFRPISSSNGHETGRPHLQKSLNLVGDISVYRTVCIKVGNEAIAAIGVGGAPGGNFDEGCAQAGLAKIADQLK
jgi:uncharacterized protein GlcG (DUF336 family)